MVTEDITVGDGIIAEKKHDYQTVYTVKKLPTEYQGIKSGVIRGEDVSSIVITDTALYIHLKNLHVLIVHYTMERIG